VLRESCPSIAVRLIGDRGAGLRKPRLPAGQASRDRVECRVSRAATVPSAACGPTSGHDLVHERIDGGAAAGR